MRKDRFIFPLLFVYLTACAPSANTPSAHLDKTTPQLLPQSPLPILDGGDVGNGGFVIIEDNNYYFYDYYVIKKNKNEYSLFHLLGDNNFPSFFIASAAIGNLATVNKNLAQKLSFDMFCFYNELQQSIQSLNKADQKVSQEYFHKKPSRNPLLPNKKCTNCSTEVAVHFIPNTQHQTPNNLIKNFSPTPSREGYLFSEDPIDFLQECKKSGTYYINANIVQNLDEKNLAALIIHEALWAYLVRSKKRLSYSTDILPLTEYIFQLSNTSNLDPFDLLQQTFELYSILGIYE